MRCYWDFWENVDLDQIRDEVGQFAYFLVLGKRNEYNRNTQDRIDKFVGDLDSLSLAA
jgi:hypothetical protein